MSKLLRIYQNTSVEGGIFFRKKVKKSFRNDFVQSFFDGKLALLLVSLAFLSLGHPVRLESQNLQAHIIPLQKIFGALRAEAAPKAPNKKVIIHKLAEEASKKSSSNYHEIQENVANIVESLDKKGIATPRVIAYAMATAERETGSTFKPIEEFGGPQQALALGYSGGERYYGRGYIQITHDYNYAKFGQQIGLGDQLVVTPELALNPKVASDILAEFFKENGVAATAEANFVAAREPINGSDHAEMIAAEAEKYLQAIEQADQNLADNRGQLYK